MENVIHKYYIIFYSIQHEISVFLKIDPVITQTL